MSNPAFTQAQMNAYFRRIAFCVRGFAAAREQTNRFRRSVVRSVQVNDWNANFTTPPVLQGVKLFNSVGNTTDAGEIIWRVVANAGNWDVNGYKATGGGSSDKVCTAVNVVAGASFALVAANSSGLTSAVNGVLSATPTAETSDKHRTLVYPDWSLQATDAFDSTDSLDSLSLQAINPMLGQQITNCFAIEGLWLSLLGTVLSDQINKQFGLSAPDGTAITVVASADQSSGAISLSVTGNLEELRNAMAANTSTAQTVLRVAPAAGSPSYSSSGAGASVGQGVLTIATIFDFMKAGTLTGICVDQTVGAEKFAFTLTPSDGTDTRTDPNLLTVGQVFKSQRLGIASMTLARTFAKTGDGSNLNFAAASDASLAVSGLTGANSNAGTLYWKTVVDGSNIDIYFYRNSSYLAGDIVAQAINVAASTVFQATAQNRSGLTVNWKTGGTLSATTGTLLAQCFQSGPPADRIDVAITNAMTGWQQWWGEMNGWYLNGATSNPTIPDWITPASGVFTVRSS